MNDPETAVETSFIRVADAGEVADGSVLAIDSEGREIALIRHGDEVYAVRDECTHAAIPLSEGDVEGCEIECWLHGSRFDVRTGVPVNLPATVPVQTFPTKLEGDAILVDLSAYRS